MRTKYFAPSTIKTPGAAPGPFCCLAVLPSSGCRLCACHAPTVIQSNAQLFNARDVRTFSKSPGPVMITLSLFQYSAEDSLLFSRCAPPETPLSPAWLHSSTGAKVSSAFFHAFIMLASHIASSCSIPGRRRITVFHGTPVRISNIQLATLYSLTSTAFLTCCLLATLNSSGSSASMPNEKNGPLTRSPQ